MSGCSKDEKGGKSCLLQLPPDRKLVLFSFLDMGSERLEASFSFEALPSYMYKATPCLFDLSIWLEGGERPARRSPCLATKRQSYGML